MSNMRKQGFTLVEILIVVIILGILAAIVIPQFTEASTNAKESSLVSNLQTLRSQIGLYKIQHNDTLPSLDSNDEAVLRLTTVTDINGEAWADGAGNKYGPYMQAVPKNPFAPADLDTMFSFGTTDAPGDNSSHWYINTTTGAINANDDKQTPDQVDHKLL